jgi:3-isopropylmalate/(R)-2-methylmalate dehydratase small subunit
VRKFNQHKGIAAPIIRNNIDTDSIIPSVEMKRVSKKGLSEGLFAAWRYTDRVARVPNPQFILNQEAYHGTSILLSGKNFGCGSSREHAVWALDEFGIRVIIASSFGAIFYANCIANGLLPISLPAQVIARLAGFVGKAPQKNQLLIDLEHRSVNIPAGETFHFKMVDSDAEMLLNGWDPVTLTLRLEEEIKSFRQNDRKTRPWIYLQK